ncbi:MAG TPA: thermonuclease family protein [Patescibacteria group bacterium]|uniref:TNase-like domain-containing protein n=1 Tax=Candidatus Amesbacteria bacterium RIFCSPLOWO2_01_FULL_48_25 TaxID=1797259 RepID=A0A1F4ZDI1_9BACT|nr:MAG: hypothetical protein A2989_05045 [Candidatus Amesbacteria bacterium RIFCSPLOWO2_01_FULL_48_25]HJZ06207.1 thermonuclease family protein [Patescibacteria group bacterium]
MKKITPKRLTADWLRKIGVKEVLIPGIIVTVAVLGVKNWRDLGPDIYKNKQAFPDSGVVRVITDGDTFELQNGVRVRMVGINAPTNDEESKNKLGDLIKNKKVWLEYDRYLDDKFGRILAWVWVGCQNPKFLPADYMHLTYNRSREGLKENPEGCKKGKLVQEEMVRTGLAGVEVYKDRGELKYEKRLLDK